VSSTSSLPPGRKTRPASARAAGTFSTYSYTWVEVTASNEPPAHGNAVASPALNSTGAESAARGRPRAMESMLGLGSTPVTEPTGPTSALISQARKPGPDPMSSTSSPGLRPRAVRMTWRWPDTSGVV